MTQDTIKRVSLQPAAEVSVDLLDNWFELTESEVLARWGLLKGCCAAQVAAGAITPRTISAAPETVNQVKGFVNTGMPGADDKPA